MVLELLVLGGRLWLLVPVRHPDRSQCRGVEGLQGPRLLGQVQPQASWSRASTSGCSRRGASAIAVGCDRGEGCSWRGASTNAVGWGLDSDGRHGLGEAGLTAWRNRSAPSDWRGRGR